MAGLWELAAGWKSCSSCLERKIFPPEKPTEGSGNKRQRGSFQICLSYWDTKSKMAFMAFSLLDFSDCFPWSLWRNRAEERSGTPTRAHALEMSQMNFLNLGDLFKLQSHTWYWDSYSLFQKHASQPSWRSGEWFALVMFYVRSLTAWCILFLTMVKWLAEEFACHTSFPVWNVEACRQIVQMWKHRFLLVWTCGLNFFYVFLARQLEGLGKIVLLHYLGIRCILFLLCCF